MHTSRIDNKHTYQLYCNMLLIRRTEELILDMFSRGELNGTTHTCIGQEANAVGIIGQLNNKKDFLISNHRCHGHYLAFGGSLEGLLAEILGHETGICGGRGGSQHLWHNNFFSNGIQGGGLAITCGIALANNLQKHDGIATVCIGDGTLGQGILYETFNMASLWNLPVLFILENNEYAQSTPASIGVAGSMAKRAEAFGISYDEISSTDVEDIYAFGKSAINYVQNKKRPFLALVNTVRLAAHSKGDDTRPANYISKISKIDPIRIQGDRLSDDQLNAANTWITKTLKKALDNTNAKTDNAA